MIARNYKSGWHKLVGGVAVIKVGAATEMEVKEKKARVEDAMHATLAPQSRKVSCPAAESLCCAVSPRWTSSSCCMRMRPPGCGSSGGHWRSPYARSHRTLATKAPLW